MLRKLPVVVRLDPEQVDKSDLIRELKIDKLRLDHELIHQPGKYAWWATLYAECSARVDLLQEKLEHLESRLFIKYLKFLHENKKGRIRVADVKHYVLLNGKYQALQKRLRHWRAAERLLKYGVRAFEQRKDVLQSYSANIRKEQDSEPKVRKKKREEDGDDE